jgi:arylsulfatase A-like enzyme
MLVIVGAATGPSMHRSGQVLAAENPAAAASSEKPRKPNIVVILADDLGWSDLGCYGGEIPTPQLDSLAAGGLRFTQFYNNAVCGPSRASLLTGLYAQRIGHTGRNWNQPTDYTRSITVAEGLKRAGYHTMMVGKWQDPDLPARRGFDHFFGPMCAGKISYFHEVQANPYYLDEQRVELPKDFYLTDALTDHALEFLSAAAKNTTTPNAETTANPFFLYVAHLAPHWPLHAREAEIAPHRERYLAAGWDESSAARRKRQEQMGLVPSSWPAATRDPSIRPWKNDPYREWQAERMSVHAAMVASVDRSTRRIVDALKERNQLDDTLILFLSDNGAAPDGGLKPTDQGFGFTPGAPTNTTWRRDGTPIRPGSGPDLMPGPPDTFAAYGLAWALSSNTPFRSTKTTGYEGGIRTPAIAHWPKGIKNPGRLTNEIGHLIDLMPTFLELASTDYPQEFEGNRRPLPLDGRSLVPVFNDKPPTDREFLAWQVPKHDVLRAGDWKIIRPAAGGPWELYNVADDGVESQNLADKRPEIVQRLSSLRGTWAADCESTGSP